MEKSAWRRIGNFNYEWNAMFIYVSHLQAVLQNPKHFFGGYLVYLEY